MLTAEQLHAYIATHLRCERLEVRGDGAHFEALIVSDAFTGLNRVRQHQRVYEALGDRMREEIHALSMKTYSPPEWETRQP